LIKDLLINGSNGIMTVQSALMNDYLSRRSFFIAIKLYHPFLCIPLIISLWWSRNRANLDTRSHRPHVYATNTHSFSIRSSKFRAYATATLLYDILRNIAICWFRA